jgi:hypothetical protein
LRTPGENGAIRGVSWKRLDGIYGIGFIAQEVQSVFPDNVFVTGNRELDDGTVIKDVLSPDTAVLQQRCIMRRFWL